MEWIKVEDRLPENGKRVLVTCSNGNKDFPAFSIYIASCYNRDGKGKWFSSEQDKEDIKKYIEKLIHKLDKK